MKKGPVLTRRHEGCAGQSLLSWMRYPGVNQSGRGSAAMDRSADLKLPNLPLDVSQLQVVLVQQFVGPL